MKDRIHQLMVAQHMNQQAFARYINIGTASLSSIFTGRTHPTMKHVVAIMTAFPNVNPNWLIKGEGGMMITDQSATPQNGENSTPDNGTESDVQMPASGDNNTDGKNADNMAENLPLFASQPKSASIHPSILPPVSQNAMGKYSKMAQQGATLVVPQTVGHRKITEIRVFFDDQTWESFVPKNK